jgi:hypothetical protein
MVNPITKLPNRGPKFLTVDYYQRSILKIKFNIALTFIEECAGICLLNPFEVRIHARLISNAN